MTPITVELHPVSVVAGVLLCLAAQGLLLVAVASVLAVRRVRERRAPAAPKPPHLVE